MRWGGDFVTPYDPIHFDIGADKGAKNQPGRVSKNRMVSMVDESVKKKIRATTIPTGANL